MVRRDIFLKIEPLGRYSPPTESGFAQIDKVDRLSSTEGRLLPRQRDLRLLDPVNRNQDFAPVVSIICPYPDDRATGRRLDGFLTACEAYAQDIRSLSLGAHNHDVGRARKLANG